MIIKNLSRDYSKMGCRWTATAGDGGEVDIRFTSANELRVWVDDQLKGSVQLTTDNEPDDMKLIRLLVRNNIFEGVLLNG